MKNKIVVGNWKCNKTIKETIQWINTFSDLYKNGNRPFKTTRVVICAPFTALLTLSQEIKKHELPIEIGAQNISPYTNGAYTGEISANLISELAKWVIIGHTERRDYFHENDSTLREKTKLAIQAKLKPIYCIFNTTSPIPEGVEVLSYEPTGAIGSGKPATAESANNAIEKISKRKHTTYKIYGGSVVPDNVAQFIHMPNIDGVLPGGASLDPKTFYQLAANVECV